MEIFNIDVFKILIHIGLLTAIIALFYAALNLTLAIVDKVFEIKDKIESKKEEKKK